MQFKASVFTEKQILEKADHQNKYPCLFFLCGKSLCNAVKTAKGCFCQNLVSISCVYITLCIYHINSFYQHVNHTTFYYPNAAKSLYCNKFNKHLNKVENCFHSNACWQRSYGLTIRNSFFCQKCSERKCDI